MINKKILFFIALATLLANVKLSNAQKAEGIKGQSTSKHIEVGNAPKTQSVKAMPNLIIKDEVFKEVNGNNMIDGGEQSSITFNISNIGAGEAKNVKVLVSLKNGEIKGLTYNNSVLIGNIKGDATKAATIKLDAGMDIPDGFADFKIEVIEEVGFDAFPLEMRVETRAFQPPLVKVTDAVFSTADGGKIQLNYPITLKIIVQNIGRGDADNVNTVFTFPNPNCILLGDSNRFDIGKLKSGESKALEFLFTATRRYTYDKLPVGIDISEKFSKYAIDTTVSVGLTQNLVATNKVVVTGIKQEQQDVQIASLSAETDKNIPENNNINQNRFALIIGNEDYTKYQNGITGEMNVEFALNDANIFKEYAVKTMGVPADNVILITNATKGQINQKIDLVSKLLVKTGKDAEFIFYYAGHGLPEENTKVPYIIPVDANGKDLQFAISLEDIYNTFAATKAAKMTFFLDACFSGGGRNSGIVAARSVRIKPSAATISGNMVVYSACSGEQSALPYKDKQHGIYTYFLLKKLQDTKGNINYDDLYTYLKTSVGLNSLKINQKDQDPGIQISPELGDAWKQWTLK
jgi:hypothetical protein